MKYALKKVRYITFDDTATDQELAILDDLKTVQLTDGQETVYADGTDGVHLAAYDQNKTTTVTVGNGSIVSGALALHAGTTEETIKGGSEVKWRETHILENATEFTLDHKAIGETGNEVKFVYKADVNGNPDLSQVYTQGASAEGTEFAYEPNTKKVTLPADAFKVGDTVIVAYYPKFSEYQRIKNDADKFSLTAKVRIYAWFTDLCTQKDVPLQWVLERGKVSGAMDLSFGDQAAVMNLTIDAITSACLGSSKNLWSLYTYDGEKIVDE